MAQDIEIMNRIADEPKLAAQLDGMILAWRAGKVSHADFLTRLNLFMDAVGEDIERDAAEAAVIDHLESVEAS